MSDVLLGLAIALGVYVAGLVVFTLTARRWRFVRLFCAAFAPNKGKDEPAEVALGISVWPILLVAGVILGILFLPFYCVIHFLPERVGND